MPPPRNFEEMLNKLGMDYYAFPELSQNLLNCLESLALVFPKEIRAFILRYDEERTNPEIAFSERVSGRTVQRWLYGNRRIEKGKPQYKLGAYHYIAAMFQLIIESVDVYSSRDLDGSSDVCRDGPDVLWMCFLPEVTGVSSPLGMAYHRQLYEFLLDSMMGVSYKRYLYNSMPWENEDDEPQHPRTVVTRGVGWPCYRTPAKHNAFPGFFSVLSACQTLPELVCLCLCALFMCRFSCWPRLLDILNAGNPQIITKGNRTPPDSKDLILKLQNEAEKIIHDKHLTGPQYLACLAFLAKTPLDWKYVASLRQEGSDVIDTPNKERVRECTLKALA